ncbi:lipopolysaccharide biosynthesis protein [Diplocloster agilis]|uniref:Oligosaccharide flippase family protein n=1 Tax=Diplocloster agilis TaxID=2850323 RepID=A0A949NH34_9FIRM|nr:oligosaccharide flippase family protein [Diplocloster agilis]MBU9735540.1 oligosaccharide flippase family protein [Diplocloster agilis]
MMRFLQNIFTRYEKISAPVKASVWFTVCGIIQRGISLFSTPIFTRLLTPEQYGVFSVYNSWYDIISIFATLNIFYGAYNNAMTKFQDDRNRITSSMQGLTTILTVILFIVYTIASDFWNGILNLSSLYVYAMFAEMLFLPAYNFWAASERYDYKYKRLVIMTVVIAAGSPLLGIIAVINTSYKAQARILSYVFVQVCVGLAFYIYNLYKGKSFFNKKYWKYALILNIPLLPHYLSSTVLNQADRIMINNMIGSGEAAIYSVAYSVASIMTIVTTAIKNTFTPFMYKSLKNQSYGKLRTTSNLLIVLVGGFTLIAMVMGPEVIYFFASSAYHDAIWVIPPVACAVFFKFLYPMFSTVEFYYEKTGFILAASCAGAIINIILNYYFINLYGYYAAGYTTLACYILYSTGHFLFQKFIFRKYGNTGNNLFDIKFIILFSVLLLLLMVGITFLYSYTWPRYIILLTLGIILVVKRSAIMRLLSAMKGSE